MNARAGLPAYAELHCLSHFSFQRGASHPAELVERACQLGYSALAITDECSLAGVVRAHVALKDIVRQAVVNDRIVPKLQLLIGSEFTVQPAADDPQGLPFKLVVLACSRDGYGHLSEFITRLRRNSPKGQYRLDIDQIMADALAECVMLVVPPRPCSSEALRKLANWAANLFKGSAWIAVEMLSAWDDIEWLAQLRAASQASGLPLVASGDVHFHVRSRKPLQDVMTAVRLGKPVTDCGFELQPNAERHLRSRMRLARHYAPDLLTATLDVAGRCSFNLGQLSYDYPQELVPPGETPTSYLRKLTLAGLGRRYADKPLAYSVKRLIAKELRLISHLGYEKFFLTVEDIVRHARNEKILCQGRGSAANSAVCYMLGVTEVDPSESSLLFERFLSKERNEPPDIDVDFEHQRREEVIQYLYTKYGRHRTALAATVISYRTRSAVRDVGKALGFDAETIDALAKSHQWWESREALNLRLLEMGINPDTPALQQWLALTQQLVGTPRHLSQHVGGFVIAADSLGRLVPVENAAMKNRTVIQWDKDDLEALGLLKVDVLALGMLSAIKHSLAFISQRTGKTMQMQDIPKEDPDTYQMIQQADTIGVFQIESRAQMSMLPRLKPKEFYDLVVQVAIVRPGPIQGGMVHPYLQARKTGEPAPYPSKLAPALSRTKGVPIFQEQVMQIVIMGAGFTPGEADQLRRSMAAWKRKGGLESYEARIVEGIAINLQDRAFGERIFEMIKGFGEYGFPESHAVGFAKLAYISSWLKCHEPAAFLAGLLNAQPMGFYSPRQLVRDAQRHGVEVHPIDVTHSEIGATLETIDQDSFSHALRDDRPQRVRLGLALVSGLGSAAAQRIVDARQQQPFANVDDLARRAQLDQSDLRHLAAADALQSLAGHRRQQVWEAAARHKAPPLLREAPVHEQILLLPAAPEADEITIDYAATGLTLRRHPLALLRDELTRRRLHSAAALQGLDNGKPARACGLVTMRQQPETAKGTIFVSIEDETGSVNVVVWSSVRDQCRAALLQSQLLAVHGTWQNVDGVCNLVAHHLENLTPLLQGLSIHSRNFH